MSTSNILIKKAFAENAGSQYRFEITDTNETDSVSKATFDKGFPPASMLPEQAGGEPPHGEDFNGILYLITKNQQYVQAGNLPRYDASFATAIGGYLKNAVVSDLSANQYRSLKDNNTAELTDTTSWVQIDALEKSIGGTVPGNTNFTGNLQKNGSDVVSKATALTDLTPYMLGWGQTWQDLTSSRTLSVTYTNTTGSPISVNVKILRDSSDQTGCNCVVTDTDGNSITIPISYNTNSGGGNAAVGQIIIPNDFSYKILDAASSGVLQSWHELR